MISAIVLAAGASLRMGTPKALLPIDDSTFLRRIVDTLRRAEVRDIVVVLGAGAEPLRRSLEWFDGSVVINTRWRDGGLSSVLAGLDTIGAAKTDAAIIWPVDHPAVPHGLILGMAAAYGSSGKKIVLPCCMGRRGHPVIFSRELFPEIRRAPRDRGLRWVVQSHPEDVCEVPTSERGVLLNIDTPESYRDLLSRLPEAARSSMAPAGAAPPSPAAL